MPELVILLVVVGLHFPMTCATGYCSPSPMSLAIFPRQWYIPISVRLRDKGERSFVVVVQTRQHLITLHNNGTGFVFNDLRRIGSYRVWGTLHRASCRWLLDMATGSSWTDKYWFSTCQEALDWITQQDDPGGRKWRACKRCSPCGRTA